MMRKRKSNTIRKVFIETSVFIRFLTNDDPKKAADCLALFRIIEQGSIRPYISNVVILEIVYVLDRLYNFARADIMNAIQKILDLRNLTVIERTDTARALVHWERGAAKYGDCLIALQVPPDVALITYDRDFLDFEGLQVLSPADIGDASHG